MLRPLESGETASASHRVKGKGNFKVKVQAYDGYEQWSEWSDLVTVSVSKSKEKSNKTPLMLFFYNLLEKFPNLFSLLIHLLELIN